MELVFHNQRALSFMKSMSGRLNINTRRRMTPFRLRPLRSFLASLLNLSSMILYVSSSTDAPIVNHSQDSPDVSPSFDNEEDKLFIEYPLDPSSLFSGNIEDEFIHFSSTPLLDSSNHENAEEFIDFSNHGGRDSFVSNFYHYHESIIIVDFLKPPVYDDLPDDEYGTPKTVEALHPKIMVMSCPRSIEVSLTSNHEIIQSPKAPHPASLCIEDPSHTQITLPPLIARYHCSCIGGVLHCKHLFTKKVVFVSFICLHVSVKSVLFLQSCSSCHTVP